MTYRCSDCVFSEVIDRKFCSMKCLKHDKTVKCMEIHCDDLILKPFQFVSHLCYTSNYEKYVKKGKFNWCDADSMASDILHVHGFAGMTLPDNLEIFRDASGKKDDDINIPSTKLRESIETLTQLMGDAYYGLPKELYDIRFNELNHFINTQGKYNKHFGLTTQKEVEKILAKYGEEIK